MIYNYKIKKCNKGNGIKTSWANEMGIFHNGILRINNNSYMLSLNFNNIKLNKGQA